MATFEELKQEMINAENAEMSGRLSGRCAWRVWQYWNLGNRTVFYFTDDEDLDVGMLTEDMMDELMIVEKSSE